MNSDYLKRIIALDIFRGILVLGMIVFHAHLHLYTGGIPESFLHWVPTGFVLFSGILIGKVLAERKSTEQLFWRGLKLLLLVAIANVPIWLKHNFPFTEIVKIFMWGIPETSAFEILIPIGFVIMTSGVLLKLPHKSGIFLCLTSLILMDIFQSYHFTFKFFVIGTMGIFLGTMKQMNTFIREEKTKGFLMVNFLVTLLCLWAFTLSQALWTVQVIFVMALFGWMPSIFSNKKISRSLVLFGQYSLILYFFHVILIQLMSLKEVFVTNSGWILISETGGIVVVCFVFIKILKQFLQKSRIAKVIYTFCFR